MATGRSQEYRGLCQTLDRKQGGPQANAVYVMWVSSLFAIETA
jgi:hypothetical protein